MVDTATTHLALVPLRNNAILRNTKSKHGIIQIMPTGSESMKTIGRQELVVSVLAGCGCDDSNISSMENKCQECQAITSWASKALSREMLRFTASELSVRGQCASVSIDDSSAPIEVSTDNDWTGNEPFVEGTKITLIENVGNRILEFEIVSVDPLTNEIVSPGSNLQELQLIPTQEDQESCEPPSQSMEKHFTLTSVGDPPPTTPVDDLPCLSAKTPRVKNTFKDHDHENAAPHPSMASSSSSLMLQQQPGPEETHPAKNEVTMINEARHQPSQSTSQPDEAPRTVVSHQDPPGVLSGSRMFLQQEDPPGLSPLKPLGITKDTVSPAEQVAKQRGLEEEKLVQHLDNERVQCVDPTWIVKAVGDILEHPGRVDNWSGDQSSNKRKSTRVGCRSAKKKRRLQLGSTNQELVEMFDKLSSLETDQWKGYNFNVIAGRLRDIDFEIVKNDPNVFEMLKDVKGIGASTLEQIQEYLSTGSISRIKELETDPKCVAMKKMMDIWGVGRVKALELVHGGCANIDQVLTGVKNGDVELDRNQLVGVECYEDLLDKMGPEEIETIGVNVRDTVKGLFPSAEVTITGSRRRGKESCGDVVMHVACPEYQEEVPEKELAKIVDALWRKGRISFHLTFLPWMETGIESEADHKSSRYVPKEAWWEATRNEKVREGHSSSYMGIFNSPTEKNKRRRVDIKFYPYRERIFASLYFTGNGHFNRSMRLWAARQFDFTLNDHGLFQRGGTQDRVMMEASREKDVFTKLGLKYVEPEDRDCFDAVVPKAGGIQAAVDLEMSEDEFREDNEQHVWID